MNSPSANPIVAVTRPKKGKQGQPKGSVATSPKEIDAIIREEYGKIYKGNVEDHAKLVSDYKEKYKEHIYHGKKANRNATM